MSLTAPWADGNTGLIDRARIAFLRALELGSGDLVSFDIGMDLESPHVISLVDDLRRAVIDGDLLVTYQPILDLVSGEITSVEVIPRWNHALKGCVSSDLILSLADRFGFVRALFDLLLGEVCSSVSHWRRQYGLNLIASMRVSVGQVCEKGFADRFLSQVEGSGVTASDVVLSLGEADVLLHWNRVFPAVRALSIYGVGIAIAEMWGRSLTQAHIQALSVDELRIDKSLIHSISKNRMDMALVDSIVAAADALGVRVIADGVEFRDQLALISEMGCSAAQGGFVGGRLAAIDVPEFIDAARVSPLLPLRSFGSVMRDVCNY